MRSRSEEDAGVQQVDAGSSRVVRQVYEAHPVYERVGDLFEQPFHQVGVGIDHHDGVAVPALRLLHHLVGYYVVHQGGLAHAGAGHVEVVTPEQVFGKSDRPPVSGGGVSHRERLP